MVIRGKQKKKEERKKIWKRLKSQRFTKEDRRGPEEFDLTL